MADFSTETELSLTVPTRELRAARQQIEEEIGPVTIDVDAAGADVGAGGMARADGSGRDRRSRRDLDIRLLTEQVDLLEEIQETLEKMGASGDGGGGLGFGAGAAGGGLLGGGLVSGGGLALGGGGLLAAGATRVGAGILQGPFDGPADAGAAMTSGMGRAPTGQNLQTATRFGMAGAEVGMDIAEMINEDELPELNFGLLNEAQAFDQHLQDIEPPALELGLSDAAQSFEEQLQTITSEIDTTAQLDVSGEIDQIEQQLRDADSQLVLDVALDIGADVVDLRRDVLDAIDEAAPGTELRDTIREEIERVLRDTFRGR